MTGEELYALYVNAQIHCNDCEVDQWEDLEASERRVWELMALRCNEPPPPGPRPAVIL